MPIAGFEHVLVDELKAAQLAPSATNNKGGFIRSTGLPSTTAPPPMIAFTNQVLPNVKLFSSPSSRALVRDITDYLASIVEQNAAFAALDWRLHVVKSSAPILQSPPDSWRRLLLTEIGLDKRLKLFKKQRLPEIAPSFRNDNELLVQLAVLRENDLALSLAVPPDVYAASSSSSPSGSFADRARWRRCLSRLPGGLVQLPGDIRTSARDAPSTAYLKLLHAMQWMGSGAASIGANEHVVDLGCSPGGWSWLALKHGARVVGVDRTAPFDPIMQHAHFRFLVRTTYSFRCRNSLTTNAIRSEAMRQRSSLASCCRCSARQRKQQWSRSTGCSST